jgi:hypothetical protein
MSGWFIMIGEGQVKVERDAALAYWNAWYGGHRWLDDLVDAGKAQRLHPFHLLRRYEARAADVVPLLDEVTGGVNLAFPLGKFDRERIYALPPDLVLTIDAWDDG